MRFLPHIAFACLLILSGLAWGEGAPPLPPGLGGESEERDSSGSPPLPAGLGGNDAQENGGAPALPPGLGGSEGTADPDGAPALPAGLGGDEESPVATQPEDDPGRPEWLSQIHGFIELRGGTRLQEDPVIRKSGSVGEARLQLQGEKVWDRLVAEVTADFVGDAIGERGEVDLRQARLTWTISDSLDLRIGRQVLTWGTGDMLFINDLFPKDWVSYFAGRDTEYLKAPSDAVKIGWYGGAANVEVVYHPQFAPDRFIRGERISYWNPLFNQYAGEDPTLDYNAPSTWFEEDELALRVYGRAGQYEWALYGYQGYWKSPGGQELIPFLQASFPKLRVYGASLRGPLGKGIFNVEAGYYDSYQDRHGANLFINNSEFRLLLGYEQELAKDLTGSIQYYLEHMMDHDAYENSQPFWTPKRDEDRHVVTVRLTKLLMNQTLTLSFFAYYSPSDNDAYLRPKAQYKLTDAWLLEMGGNVFLGESSHTFFGQFENNTNAYAAIRYSF